MPHKDLNLRWCCDGFRYIPVKQLLGLIKNIKIDVYFLMIWIIVFSELLTNLPMNNKLPVILINFLLAPPFFFIFKLTHLAIPFLLSEKYSISFHYFFISCILVPQTDITVQKLSVVIEKSFKKNLRSIIVLQLR